ncbi:polysaccharide deacetylase family protein [uncultured Aquabacterium sp.]|uniref:polysaccharide deacetylase family protein n=1 Tax=uncultured Aquabacterium sp. TaxID=158753 RepID=UPI002626A75C|nr:polysaccharide deacetylase family protein [uncultured Aquabacterium sp.]
MNLPLPPSAGRPMLSVTIHDVAPSTWPACERVMDAVRAVADVPMTLLVVPRYHLRPSNHAFEQRLEALQAQGHELALHGYSHLDDGEPANWVDHVRRRWYTAGEGEFSALSQDEALRRLHAGARWFARRGWPLHGFVAPAWLMSRGTWQALDQLPLSYTATLRAVYSLPQAQRITSACLAFSTRTAWRRAVSLPRNAWVAARWHAQPLVRFELHPHDADHRLIRQCWSGRLRALLAEREARTVHAAVAALRHQGRSQPAWGTRP